MPRYRLRYQETVDFRSGEVPVVISAISTGLHTRRISEATFFGKKCDCNPLCRCHNDCGCKRVCTCNKQCRHCGCDKLERVACGCQGHKPYHRCDGCFVDSSGILMADGTVKAVEAVRVGDKVMTLDRGTGEYVPGDVGYVNRYMGTCTCKVRFTNGSIVECSPIQHFWNGSSWVETQALHPGDRIGDLEVVELTRMEKGQYLTDFLVMRQRNYIIIAGDRKLVSRGMDCHD